MQACLNLLEDPGGDWSRGNHHRPPPRAAFPVPLKRGTPARDSGAHRRGGSGGGPGWPEPISSRSVLPQFCPRWPQGGRREGLRKPARRGASRAEDAGRDSETEALRPLRVPERGTLGSETVVPRGPPAPRAGGQSLQPPRGRLP